jgi:hypothetical protein
MKSPFVWGKGGRAMTPEEVDRERQLVALARAKMGDTSPVGHWTQGATRVVDALGAVLREKRTNKAEAAGLAGADERIAAILSGQGGGFGGGYSASSSGGGSPSGSWTPNAPGPSSVDVATQGVTGGASFAGLPKADTGILQGGGDFGSAVMTPQEMLIEGAKRRGLDPIDVATAISYETGGKFDPTIKGPTTQWGTHEGLIQFGDPQGEKYGVDFSSPEAAWRTQLDPTSGGVWGYLEDTGVKPGMGLPEIYSAINAGAVGRMGASDANNGGAPGTVADKVAGMGAHRDKAAAFLGGTWTPNPDAGGGAVTMSTSGTGGGYGGGGNVGGMDIASLLALQSDPWVAKKYGGVVDALMGQQFSRQNALWEQQQKMADPMYQAQLEMAQLELDKAQNPAVDPWAGTKEVGGVLYGPDKQPLITPPPKPGYRLMTPAEVAADPRLDPTKPYQVSPEGKIETVGGGGTTINNNMGGDKFAEEFAKGDAATVETVNNAGLAAQRNLGRIDQLEGLLAANPTGMGASLAQAAGEWGIPTEGLSEIQAAQAIINSLVPEQRQPGSGPMSDADLALFKESLPRIMNQPGGNQTIIDTMRGIAQYDAEGAAIVQRMRLPPDDPNYLDRSAAFSALQNRPNPLESIKAAGGGGDAPTGNKTSSGVQWSIAP